VVIEREGVKFFPKRLVGGSEGEREAEIQGGT